MMMTQRDLELQMTDRLMRGGYHCMHARNTKRDVAVSSTGVRAGAACGGFAPEIHDPLFPTLELKLEALLETIPAGLARAIMARKDSIVEKISAATKFFQG